MDAGKEEPTRGESREGHRMDGRGKDREESREESREDHRGPCRGESRHRPGGASPTRSDATEPGTPRASSGAAARLPPFAPATEPAPASDRRGNPQRATASRGTSSARNRDTPIHPMPRPARHARRPRLGTARAFTRGARWLGELRALLATDYCAVALAFVWRTLARLVAPTPRDAGERTAERFLRLLGFRLVARNWRRTADRRDEADLVMLSPGRDTLVVVEVKRAAGPWDPLERIDGAKREVLWRIAGDLADRPPAPGIRRVRVDLVAVRGSGRGCEVMRHEPGFLERPARPP